MYIFAKKRARLNSPKKKRHPCTFRRCIKYRKADNPCPMVRGSLGEEL